MLFLLLRNKELNGGRVYVSSGCDGTVHLDRESVVQKDQLHCV